MKNAMVLTAVLALAAPAAAAAPESLWIDVHVDFTVGPDGITAAGTFVASGAVDDEGTDVDAPWFSGEEVHVDRLLTGANGATIGLAINGNFVSWLNVPPTWCPAPPSAEGTYVTAHNGNWSIVSGTGPYANLQGTGAWATWVVHADSGLPLYAKECLSGRAHDQQ